MIREHSRKRSRYPTGMVSAIDVMQKESPPAPKGLNHNYAASARVSTDVENEWKWFAEKPQNSAARKARRRKPCWSPAFAAGSGCTSYSGCGVSIGHLSNHPTMFSDPACSGSGSLINYFFDSATTCWMNGTASGVPTPVTLSQPGPVVSDESVPKVNTSQRVEDALWNRALM